MADLPPAPAHAAAPGCPLCSEAGGRTVWRDADWRIVRVDDADFPALYRLIAARHVAEFTDLTPSQRGRCMALVAAVEQAMREQLRPTKINLATLGNVVPHLHWHVIARFEWDSHHPQPVWGPRQREVSPPAAARLAVSLEALDGAVVAAAQAAPAAA